MRKLSGTLVVLFLLALAGLGWMFTHVDQRMPGATYVGLAMGCRLEVYDRRVVTQTTVRLACPGKTLVQVWPLKTGALWCQGCMDNFWKQLDWGEILPDINLP